MDRGYIDFARLYTFTQQAAFFVIRAKRNLDFTRRTSRRVDKTTGLRSDQTIVLHGPQTSKDYPDTLRRISYVDPDTAKRLVFLTHNCPVISRINSTGYKGGLIRFGSEVL